MSDKLLTPNEIGLTAAIVAIESSSDGDKLAGLPFGPFDAVSNSRHRDRLAMRQTEISPGGV